MMPFHSGVNYEEEILKLKKSLNAVILAHYYQESEIQDVADFVGDSLALAQKAATTSADTIVFCGVHFMAETAKILNPGKLVLLPDLNAGCSLADRCPPDAFRAFKEKHPGVFVVSYVNCSAAVKALSDVICTSSNAQKIVSRVPPERQILFAPDQHLGRYVMKQTGREMILWPGSCMVVTEAGIIHQMQKQAPHKQFIPAPPDNGCACNECPHMKLNTMEKLYLCMRDRKPELVLPPELQHAALRPLQRMLEWT